MCEKGSGIMVASKNKKFGWITILLTLVADHRKREFYSTVGLVGTCMESTLGK